MCRILGWDKTHVLRENMDGFGESTYHQVMEMAALSVLDHSNVVHDDLRIFMGDLAADKQLKDGVFEKLDRKFQPRCLHDVAHSQLAVTFPRATDDTLHTFMVKNQNLDRALRKDIIHQLVLAVQHVHEKGWLHRDIKPTNVLVWQEEKHDILVQLADFNLAKPYFRGLVVSDCSLSYTDNYVPPELLLQPTRQELNYAMDIWALGITCAQLLGRQPDDYEFERFQLSSVDTKKETQEQRQKREWDRFVTRLKAQFDTKTGDLLVLKKHAGAAAAAKLDSTEQEIDFLVCMLNFNPQKRHSAKRLLDHPYLASQKTKAWTWSKLYHSAAQRQQQQQQDEHPENRVLSKAEILKEVFSLARMRPSAVATMFAASLMNRICALGLSERKTDIGVTCLWLGLSFCDNEYIEVPRSLISCLFRICNLLDFDFSLHTRFAQHISAQLSSFASAHDREKCVQNIYKRFAELGSKAFSTQSFVSLTLGAS